MNPIYGILVTSAIVLFASISGCSKTEQLSVDDGDEESNIELTLTDTYDKVSQMEPD